MIGLVVILTRRLDQADVVDRCPSLCSDTLDV